jgi:tRNA modification GTPase
MTAGALTQGESAQTIFALASGVGRAAIAVLRISGAKTGAILEVLAGRRPDARRATLCKLSSGGEVLDQALVLWFPRPASFTGEDAAELHVHGGRAVLEGVSQALVRLGARPAEPGEFSRRAFLNGKLDLLEAEAIADLVDAETAAQRRQALRQLDGALGELYREWATRLRDLLAHQEAVIDFSDQDLPEETEREVYAGIAGLMNEIGAHLADAGRGERLRDGFTVVVAGAPNVGKSSLLNALAAQEVAIVSPRPGTTRDPIEVRLDLEGVPVALVDTAGLREAEDEIEAEGIRRARARAEAADLVLFVAEAGAVTGAIPDGALVVANKIDLAPAAAGALGVSARTGEGVAGLRAALAQAARARLAPSGAPVLTRARHRAALVQSRAHLEDAQEARFADQKAEDLRLALRALGRITGEVGVEDLLDVIFRGFCIGK